MDKIELAKLLQRLSSLQKEFKWLHRTSGLIGISDDKIHIKPEFFRELEAQGLVDIMSRERGEEFLRIEGRLINGSEVIALDPLDKGGK